MEAGKVGLETDRERSLKMLADMGVQVWFSRPATRVEGRAPAAADTNAAVTTQADTAPAAVAQCDPVTFHWAKGSSGLLLFSPQPDDAVELMASDIVRALDWRFNESSEAATQPVLGEFKWPQLLSSTGTPERSLHALLTKHLPGEARWLAITQDIAQAVTTWLQPAPTITLLNLVDLRSALDEPDVKRALWQQILTYKR